MQENNNTMFIKAFHQAPAARAFCYYKVIEIKCSKAETRKEQVNEGKSISRLNPEAII